MSSPSAAADGAVALPARPKHLRRKEARPSELTAAALTLLILIIKMVDNWAGVAGCVVAALTAVYFHDLPNKLWVLVAIVIGVAVALIVERFLPNMPLRHASDSGKLDDVECET